MTVKTTSVRIDEARRSRDWRLEDKVTTQATWSPKAHRDVLGTLDLALDCQWILRHTLRTSSKGSVTMTDMKEGRLLRILGFASAC